MPVAGTPQERIRQWHDFSPGVCAEEENMILLLIDMALTCHTGDANKTWK